MTETEFNILDALAIYRFLTVKQLHRLQITKNEGYLYALLRDLEKRDWVECIRFGFKGAGLSYVWRLRPLGAQAHAEEAQGEPVAVPRRLSKQDREHCLAVIDFHISVREFA